jgi:hypothetical protein
MCVGPTRRTKPEHRYQGGAVFSIPVHVSLPVARRFRELTS